MFTINNKQFNTRLLGEETYATDEKRHALSYLRVYQLINIVYVKCENNVVYGKDINFMQKIEKFEGKMIGIYFGFEQRKYEKITIHYNDFIEVLNEEAYMLTEFISETENENEIAHYKDLFNEELIDYLSTLVCFSVLSEEEFTKMKNGISAVYMDWNDFYISLINKAKNEK